MKQKKETEIHSYKANMDRNAVQHVAPVAAPAPPSWPPPWLAALSPPADAPRQVNLASLRLRGWRLPNGVVVCRCCCPKPAGAVPVVLADGDGGPQWVEEPTANLGPSTTSPEAPTLPQTALTTPEPQQPSNDPQWL